MSPRPWLPGDPDPGGEPIPCAEVVVTTVDLAAENADLKAQIAALSNNDLECSQQLMAARTELKRLQDRLDERDRVAESIPPGTFTVNKPA